MTEVASPDLYDAVLHRKFGRSTCFLCGCRLNRKNRTDEHVIPKWAQRKYHLADQELHLLNQTTIPYRQLTIPCCFTCNNKHLQPLERRMSEAVSGGARAVKSLTHHEIFLWMGKIFYGLLYRELFLPFDRTDIKKTTIANKTLLRRFNMHHLFLQSIRVPMNFVNFSPSSILIVNLQEPAEAKLRWDFRDHLTTMSIACRMGSVGIIAVLQDGGAQIPMFPLLKIGNRKLHPTQFTEVVAKVFYRAILFNRTPKYLISDSEQKSVIQSPLMGFSRKPLFDRWNQRDYAGILSQMTRQPLSSLFQEPDLVMTWLRNPDGSPKHLKL